MKRGSHAHYSDTRLTAGNKTALQRKRTTMSDRVDQDDVRAELEAVEMREWLDSLDYVLQHGGPERVKRLLQQLQVHAQKAGVDLPFSANTPYINTIPADKQPLFPGSRDIERRLKSLVRWNAMAMVVRANRADR